MLLLPRQLSNPAMSNIIVKVRVIIIVIIFIITAAAPCRVEVKPQLSWAYTARTKLHRDYNGRVYNIPSIVFKSHYFYGPLLWEKQYKKHWVNPSENQIT